MRRHSPDDDPPFADWLAKHGQTHVLSDASGASFCERLNETPDRIGLRYARKVFVDGFLKHPRGFEVEIPSVPLGRLYGDELMQWAARNITSMCSFAGALGDFRWPENRVETLELRNDDSLTADWYLSTVPFDRFA